MHGSEPDSLATIDVAILADNRLVREALGRLLHKEKGIHVLATYSLASHAVKEVARTKPHVLILDPTGLLPRCTQFILEVTRAVPGLKILLISMEADATTFFRVVAAGVVGYLLRDSSASDVVAAVRSVSEGKAVCPPQLCLLLFEWFAHQEIPISTLNGKLRVGLTRREVQVLRVMSCGCTNKEIASHFKLSEQTVKNHVHRILQKMGASNRVKALEVFHVRALGRDSSTIETQLNSDASSLTESRLVT